MHGKKGRRMGTEQSKDAAASETRTSTKSKGDKNNASSATMKKAVPPKAGGNDEKNDLSGKEQENQDEEAQIKDQSKGSSPSSQGKPPKPATRRSARSTAGSASTGDHHRHHHDHLDEATLDGMYRFLKTPRLREDKLLEDELLVAMHRTQKTALQRARSFRALGNTGDTEDLLFDECLAEVEEQTLADELFQDMIHYLEEEEDNDSHSKDSLASGSVNKKSLDRRTVSWVKRSIGVGLRKRNVPSRFQQHLLTQNTGRVTTRGKAKSTAQSKRKKSQQDLDLLYDVVKEIAKERGEPFRLPKPSSRRSVSPVYQADDEVSKGSKAGSKRKATSKAESSKSKKVPRTGSNISSKTGAPSKQSKSKRKRSEDNENAATSFKRSKQETKAKGPPTVDIVALESQRRRLVRSKELPARRNIAYDSRIRTELPEEYTKMGVIHRLPSWSRYSKSIMVPRTPRMGLEATTPREEVPRKMPSTGKFLRYAICSSFMSDIDRAWYDKAWDLSGQSRVQATFVASSEWKKERKGTRKQIRRFSKAFLKDQLTERNEYRQGVRLLQQKPELADRIAFPFVVPAHFRPGVRVTVALRAHRMVEHGTVVKYEAKKSEYLISFDRQSLGFAFYPDVDLASQWTCDLTLYDKARHALVAKNGGSHLFSGVPSGGLAISDAIKEATMFQPFQIPESQSSRARKSPTEHSLCSANEDHDMLLQEVAERQSLVVLMASINTALVRKDTLIAALEELGKLMASHDPAQLTCTQEKSTSAQLKSHRLWLEHCIRHTTWMLDTQFDYLKALYGTAYLPKADEFHQRSEINRDTVTDLLHQISTKPSDVMTSACCQNLLNTVKEFTSKLIGPTVTDTSLGTVMDLLISSSFASSMASEPLALAIANAGLQTVAAKEEPDTINGNDPLLTQLQLSREEALQDLHAAMEMLQMELSLSKLSG